MHYHPARGCWAEVIDCQPDSSSHRVLVLSLTPASKAAYVERCAKALWKWHWPTVPVGERGSLGMWKCRELAQTALASLSPHLKTKG